MLNNNAILVYLSISVWTAKKKDNQAVNTVAAHHHTDSNQLVIHKHLVDKRYLEKIKKIAGQIRTYHYEMTLPWLDGGQRLLPARVYMEYTQKMREFSAKFENAVNEFLPRYLDARKEAQEKLGSLFNFYEYPDSFEIREQFGVKFSTNPVPSNDFRISVTEEEKAILSKQVTEQNKEATKQAMCDLVDRIRAKVQHMHDKLTDGSVFRDSLVENIATVCDVAKTLDVSDDIRFSSIVDEIKASLTKHSAGTIREVESAKQNAVETAEQALQRLAAYTGTL